MEMQVVVTPSDRDHWDAVAGRTTAPGNKGWIALGCLGLTVLLVIWLGPIVGMVFWAIQEERDDEWRRVPPTRSRPVAPAPVCRDVAPEALARIEAGLTVPGLWLRGARAVDSARDPSARYVGADVQGVYYEGERNIAVWRITEGSPDDAGAARDAPIFAVNILATQVSSFPIDIDLNASLASLRCTGVALSGD